MFSVVGSVVAAGCINGRNGQITLTSIGGTPPYTFMWSDGVTTQNRTGLSVGNYWVIVTDSTNDTGSASFMVNGANLLLDYVIQQPSGTLQKGSIKVVPLTTSASFTYLWSTGDTTAMIDNLSAGDYTVTVTNAEGCSKTETITLVGDLQYEINSLRCCASKFAVKYVCERRGGEWEEAKKSISLLKMLQGVTNDICNFSQGGNCLTDITPTLQLAKGICRCCNNKDYVPN